MAQVSLKRHRDAVDCESESDPKKQKSINQILSILDQEEDHDLSSSLLSSLENEIICTLDFDTLQTDPSNAVVEDGTVNDGASPDLKSSEDEKERVIRHLLEASDDELGLPASKSLDYGVVIYGGDSFGFCQWLWELEDEAANYYTLLQSELFM